jgi:hypothetical protein
MGEMMFYERSKIYLRVNINKTRLCRVDMGWESCGAMKGVKNLSEET